MNIVKPIMTSDWKDRLIAQTDIARVILFMCSEDSGFITGENITVDGGITKLMIYHNDHGWKYDPKAGA